VSRFQVGQPRVIMLIFIRFLLKIALQE
jgi:hypothetical protein